MVLLLHRWHHSNYRGQGWKGALGQGDLNPKYQEFKNLEMNVGETEIMVIVGRGRYYLDTDENLSEFYFHEHVILAQRRIKYLGVLIDSKLSNE